MRVFRIDGGSFFEPILGRRVSTRLRLWGHLSSDRLLGPPAQEKDEDVGEIPSQPLLNDHRYRPSMELWKSSERAVMLSLL